MNNEPMKKYAGFAIGAAIVIVAIIIIIIATRHQHLDLTDTAAVPATPADIMANAATSATPASPASPAGSSVVTMTALQVRFVSQTATSSSDGSTTKHGLYTIQFAVNAADKDLVISPSCHTTTSTDGVSFSFLDNGVATTDGIGTQSCLITSVSGASVNSSKRFVVPAYTAGTFQLVVAAHPTNNGMYKVAINGIGYALTDESGTTAVAIDAATKATLQTNSLSL